MFMQTALKTFRQRCRLFVASQSGVSAVEFALLLPIMLVLYAGCVELTTALTIDRKVSRAASTLADLLAQDAVTLLGGTASAYTTEVNGIMGAATAIFEPYSTSTAKLLLMVVTIESPTKQTVTKCTQTNDTCASEGAVSPISVPTTIATSGQVVIGRVQYTYTSPFSGVFKSVTGSDTYNLEHIFYMKPRTN